LLPQAIHEPARFLTVDQALSLYSDVVEIVS